jgi:hypothetical protein
MKFKLERPYLYEEYTIGKFYINEKEFSDSIEDKDRDYNYDGDLDDPGEDKVWGRTAIPYGKYKVILTQSPKFKRLLPLILDVKNFKGIRIHSGSTAKDSAGCILLGKLDKNNQLYNSKKTIDKLVSLMLESKQLVWDLEII